MPQKITVQDGQLTLDAAQGVYIESPVADTTTPILTLQTELVNVDRRFINFWEGGGANDGFYIQADYSPVDPNNQLIFGSDKPSGEAETLVLRSNGTFSFDGGNVDYDGAIFSLDTTTAMRVGLNTSALTRVDIQSTVGFDALLGLWEDPTNFNQTFGITFYYDAAGNVASLRGHEASATGTIALSYPRDAATISLHAAGAVALTTDAAGIYSPLGSIYLAEKAAAGGDTAGRGQLWIRTDNTLMFTDEASTDYAIGGGTSGAVSATGAPLNNEIAVFTDAVTIDSDSTFTWDGTTATATNFAGDGSSLTSLTAANISAGSLVTGVNSYFTASTANAAHKVPFMNYTGIASINAGMLHDDAATFTYNPSTNTLVAGTFSGALSGNATSATTAAAWTTTRTIDMSGDISSDAVNIDGSGNITITTTTIAAKAVDVAMLADGTDGELITWSATGVAATVAVGTATHVLTSNGIGVAPTFQAVPAGGTVTSSGSPLVNEVAVFTTATDIDSDSAFMWDGTDVDIAGTGGLVITNGADAFAVRVATDVNFSHAGSPDWNITGVVAINAGTVDADFDAITGTSLTTDLSGIAITVGGTTPTVEIQDAGDIHLRDTVGTTEGIHLNNTGTTTGTPILSINSTAATPRTEFRDGQRVYIYDSANSDAAYLQQLRTSAPISFDFTGVGTVDSFYFSEPITIQEQTAASADAAGRGQIWVRTEANGSRLYYTDDTGDDKPVGMAAANIILNTTSDMTTDTVAQSLVNGVCLFDNATPYTLTLEPSTDEEFPVGASLQVVVAGTATITITEGATTTLWLVEGGTVTDTAGGATMGEGVATIFRSAAATYYIWGTGITA